LATVPEGDDCSEEKYMKRSISKTENDNGVEIPYRNLFFLFCDSFSNKILVKNNKQLIRYQRY